jgi:hypothetical protein
LTLKRCADRSREVRTSVHYHVVRVREIGRQGDNPVIAYYGVTTNYQHAEYLADIQPAVGGTYVDVFESDSSRFDMSFLGNA